MKHLKIFEEYITKELRDMFDAWCEISFKGPYYVSDNLELKWKPIDKEDSHEYYDEYSGEASDNEGRTWIASLSINREIGEIEDIDNVEAPSEVDSLIESFFISFLNSTGLDYKIGYNEKNHNRILYITSENDLYNKIPKLDDVDNNDILYTFKYIIYIMNTKLSLFIIVKNDKTFQLGKKPLNF